MQRNLQKQPQVKILPAFSVNENLRLREADSEDIAKLVRVILSQKVDVDNDVTITLVEKNLKIIADMVLMKEALTYLVRNLMDAIPGCNRLSPTNNQVNFEMESLLKSDDSVIGACAFIPLTAADSVGEKIKEKILKPYFNTKKYGNDLCLATAYRIISKPNERIKVKSRLEHSAEVNMYLPLTKLEILNVMSIPVG